MEAVVILTFGFLMISIEMGDLWWATYVALPVILVTIPIALGINMGDYRKTPSRSSSKEGSHKVSKGRSLFYIGTTKNSKERRIVPPEQYGQLSTPKNPPRRLRSFGRHH